MLGRKKKGGCREAIRRYKRAIGFLVLFFSLLSTARTLFQLLRRSEKRKALAKQVCVASIKKKKSRNIKNRQDGRGEGIAECIEKY